MMLENKRASYAMLAVSLFIGVPVFCTMALLLKRLGIAGAPPAKLARIDAVTFWLLLHVLATALRILFCVGRDVASLFRSR